MMMQYTSCVKVKLSFEIVIYYVYRTEKNFVQNV